MKARKENLVEELHGISVSDPYRWLEDAANPEVAQWIADQNAEVDKALKTESFHRFSKELEATFKVVNFSCPVPVNGTYFYRERQPDEDQWVVYMKKGLNGTPVRLIDPNGKREGNTTTVDFGQESTSGKYIAYGLSEGGNEMATLYIKDTETNENLSETIPNCRYSKVRWLPDDSGFFYTRNPRPGTVPDNEAHLHVKVYMHVLGTDPERDTLIFGADRPKDDMIDIELSPDGRYLAIQASQTWTEQDVFIYETDTKTLKPLVTGVPAKFSPIFLYDKVLLLTNYQANNSRVLQASYDAMYQPIDAWKEFVPERDAMLQQVEVTKEKVLIEYLENVSSTVATFDHEGTEQEPIPLPPFSSLMGIGARVTESEFFYGVESFTFPHVIHRFDPETEEYVLYQETENPIDASAYETEQEWYSSKDGTQAPLFLFHRKGIERTGKTPTILYGYGGFGSNVTPTFMRNWLPWIERGGIFAIANIRGGGEFGDSWHKAGIKEKKQTSYDDFIGAAEFLISEKYTSSEHLGIIGASNGGLLVCAVAVQRPDLFNAVCSRVPLADMVRFPLFGIAMRWIHEYGNPDVPEELHTILTWCPYHNVKEGVEYPATLFTTANKDTRVDPLHARKMAARLAEVNEKNPVLVLTEMEAGHGPGKPIAKIVESQALILEFFAQHLSLDTPS